MADNTKSVSSPYESETAAATRPRLGEDRTHYINYLIWFDPMAFHGFPIAL